MVAARWRIRRMWGIQTSLMDAEILNQESQSAIAAGNRAYMAKAFKYLSDDSRALQLASRYESRLHRIYNQAYAILRDLQQMRQSKPPASPPSGVWPAQPAPDPPETETAKGTQDPPNPPESNKMPSGPTSNIQNPTSALMPPEPPAAFADPHAAPAPHQHVENSAFEAENDAPEVAGDAVVPGTLHDRTSDSQPQL